MKTIFALLLAAGAAVGASAPAFAQPSVGISIGINQPGVYGRITIGDVPPPALVYAQPVIVAPAPVAASRQPIYLYVPPEHAQNWRRYCARYAACGQPVFFVQDHWVRERYEHEHPGWEHGRHRGEDDRGEHGRGHNRHDRHD